MKINDKNFPLFPVLLIFILVYLFTALRPVEKKLDIKPEWTVFIDENTVEQAYAGEKLYPFKYETRLGYYTADGKIVSLIPVENRGAVSAGFWALYDSDAENTTFFTPDNEQSGILNGAGFPFFTENGIFTFHPGGASFSRHNEKGETQWIYENYLPVTSFSSSPAGCSAGFADGKLICIDNEGKITGDFYPGGSSVQIIFGSALSHNGTYTACVSGLDKQRIVIAELEHGKAKIIYHTYLKDELTEQTLVQFSSDDRYAFFAGKTELISVRLDEKKVFFIPVEGKILCIKEFGSKDIFFILSKKSDTYSVTVLCEGRFNKGSFSFQAENAFLDAEDGSIYVGTDNRISKMTLRFD